MVLGIATLSAIQEKWIMSSVKDSKLSLIVNQEYKRICTVSQCMATNTSFITAQVCFMSKNYWCVRRGSFPPVCEENAGPNQTTTGGEISSPTAPRRADRFPSHQTCVLAASPPGDMGCSFEPVSHLPKTALKSEDLPPPKAVPSYSLSWRASWDSFHTSPIWRPIL